MQGIWRIHWNSGAEDEKKIASRHGYGHCNVVSVFKPAFVQNLTNEAYFVVKEKHHVLQVQRH